MVFQSNHLELSILRKQSYNLRWAEQPADVIPLTAADLDLPVAEPIVRAIQDAAGKNCFNYGPATGLPIFKQALSNHYSNRRQISLPPDLFLPIDSAAYGIYLTCKTLLNPGDEAIIFDPVDFLFRHSIESVGAKAVTFSTPAEQSTIDFELIKPLINSHTKMICLCNPLNPTGKVFTRKELMQLSEIAREYQIYVLSDEVWSDIVFEPNVFTSIASIDNEISQLTVTVTGFSKSFGLAGLRVGAIFTANRKLYQKLLDNSGHLSTIHGVNVLAQIAATAALNECQSWQKEFLKHLEKMRDLSIQKLNEMPGVQCLAPQGCFVAFANIKDTGLSSEKMHQYLLQRARVAVVPGLQEWFGAGAEGHIRISFATSEEILSEALSRIHQSISRL
jgi:aspartate/methionine/tyrosine aminotransferase